MNPTDALAAIRKMKVRSLSVMITSTLIVARTSRGTWRLGEVCGDWIMHGTAEQVIARAYAEA